MNQLTHINENGLPSMVDVSEKQVTKRSATARCTMFLPEAILAQITGDDILTKKGSVFQTAIIAGIMAAKKTGELIPLCHTLGLEHCNISLVFNEAKELLIECTASVSSKTGVEMEALVGANIAALTVYDMCKALSQDMVIKETRLIEKTGGKHDISQH